MVGFCSSGFGCPVLFCVFFLNFCNEVSILFSILSIRILQRESNFCKNSVSRKNFPALFFKAKHLFLKTENKFFFCGFSIVLGNPIKTGIFLIKINKIPRTLPTKIIMAIICIINLNFVSHKFLYFNFFPDFSYIFVN